MPINFTLELQDMETERLAARGGLSSLLSVGCCVGGHAELEAGEEQPEPGAGGKTQAQPK
jgi:hypothetical protein